MIDLVRPDVGYQRSYLDATDEFGDSHRDGDGMWAAPPEGDFLGYAFTRDELETPPGFARFVAHRLRAAAEDTPRRAGGVPCTFLWIAEDETYLGSLAIRHRLTDYLLATGGHIGYSVRPSARRRGVATEAFQLSLPVAAGLGIDPVLVTCLPTNTASKQVILAGGGVFEDARDGETERYWVPTTPPAG